MRDQHVEFFLRQPLTPVLKATGHQSSRRLPPHLTHPNELMNEFRLRYPIQLARLNRPRDGRSTDGLEIGGVRARIAQNSAPSDSSALRINALGRPFQRSQGDGAAIPPAEFKSLPE
ncbi:hypothetical protein B1810_12375 [Panacagrimonas perspica]|nr:hypothetical protein B1810_12375 [Panacagrimonas perspica]